MARCRECTCRLDGKDSQICKNGHHQRFDDDLSEEHTDKRHDEGNEFLEDDVEEITPSNWKPSPRSKRQGLSLAANHRPRNRTPSSSASTSSPNQRAMTVYKVTKERTSNPQRTDRAKKIQESGLTCRFKSMSPQSVSRIINVYLCEPTPAKPRDCYRPFRAELPLDTPLESPEQIHQFIMRLIPTAAAIYEHSQLNSGELRIDYTRRAFIAQKQTSQVPLEMVFPPYASVRHLILEFGDDEKSARSIIHFMVPVKRRARGTRLNM